MLDMGTVEQRSRIMSRIRSKDTQPEMIVRRMLFSMGYGYFKEIDTTGACPLLTVRPLLSGPSCSRCSPPFKAER